MVKLLKKFRKDDSGAVTVDFVVLTAAVVVLGGVVYTAISDSTEGVADRTATWISTQGPVAADGGGDGDGDGG